jgi:hypothetical protein
MQENHSVLYLLAKLNFAEGCFSVAESCLEKLLAHPDTNSLDMYRPPASLRTLARRTSRPFCRFQGVRGL